MFHTEYYSRDDVKEGAMGEACGSYGAKKLFSCSLLVVEKSA
jgi:hypothetical protein